VEQFRYKSEDKIAGSARDYANIHDQWIGFINRHLYKYRLSSLPRDEHFQIRAESRTVDGFTLARFITVGGKSRLVRDSSDISDDMNDRCAFYLSIHGKLEFEQFGRVGMCEPNSFTFISSSDSVTHVKLGDNDTLCLLMPRAFVSQRLINVESHCARTISSHMGMGQLAYETLAAFQHNAAGLSDPEFRQASSVVGDLLLIAVRGDIAAGVSLSSARMANLARAKRVVRCLLSDLDLTVSRIADECGFSVGYLHNLFRDDGRTVWEFVKGERLQRARELLMAPGPNGNNVTEIALASGFSNMSHFSTAFKRAFGRSPREYLRQ
jgi:AraC family transcriptional regulator, positive regulator of tynA and feaB